MKLLWLDLETTGLSPERDAILELAFTEATLDKPFTIGTMHNAVIKFTADRATLDPFILDMHSKNGLLDACAKSPTVLADVEDWLLAIVPEVADKEGRVVLAGSAIHFDHAFVRVHLPRLAARLSHRHYDVSAIKLFCRSLGMPRLPKAEAHRAAADVRESVDHARRCAAWLTEPVRHSLAALGLALREGPNA